MPVETSKTCRLMLENDGGWGGGGVTVPPEESLSKQPTLPASPILQTSPTAAQSTTDSRRSPSHLSVHRLATLPEQPPATLTLVPPHGSLYLRPALTSSSVFGPI